MSWLNARLDAFDGFQRRHRVLAFPWAVNKRYGEDHGGWLGALVSYYGFFSLLPLLLAFVTLAYRVLGTRPSVLQDLLNALWTRLPFVGQSTRTNVQPISGSPTVVAVSVIVAVWGAVGAARVLQDALNTMWSVPRFRRPGFVPKVARGAGAVLVMGAGVLGTALLAALSFSLSLPVVAVVLTALANIAINTALTVLLFRLLTARTLHWSDLAPGAVFVGAGTYVITALGSLYVDRVVAGATAIYGSFAAIIGLLAWVSLLVQVLVYGNLVNVVRVEHLWPRTLTGRRLGDADRRAVDLTMRREALVAGARPSSTVRRPAPGVPARSVSGPSESS